MIIKFKRMITAFQKIQNNEDGSVLAMSMLILLTITALVIYGSNRSSIETHIASNEKFHRIAFYAADSGTYTAPKLISEALRLRGTPVVECLEPDPENCPPQESSYGSIEFLYESMDDSNQEKLTLYRELVGYDTSGETKNGYIDEEGVSHGTEDEHGNLADLWYPVNDTSTDTNSVNITRLRAVNVVGGGAEFASGTDGSGVGLKGILYYVESNGRGPNESISTIGTQYQYIARTSGGL